MNRGFRIIAATPRGFLDPAVAIAGSRAGAVGLLDLGGTAANGAAAAAVNDLVRLGRSEVGVRFESGAGDAAVIELIARLPERTSCLVAAPGLGAGWEEPPWEVLAAGRERGLLVLGEVSSVDEAAAAVAAGVDGLIARGSEGGGRIEDETTFVLLQRLLQSFSLPAWARGGVGLHSAAACAAAGAAGVVLADELLLVRESSLPETVRRAVAALDGSETSVVGTELGRAFRFLGRPGCVGAEALGRRHLEAVAEGDESGWRAYLSDIGAQADGPVGWRQDQVWPVGQDASLAAGLGARFKTTGGVVTGVLAAVEDHLRAAREAAALAPAAALAESHGTRFPVVQGPMTRVSDVAPFAAAVADAGALPFIALALLRAGEVEALLGEASGALGERPWGVGILGFVPRELREEQLEVVRRYKPPFALIAGGRPDQAAALAADGITSYLHVPSPRLLDLYWDQGARHFVFEGRECGGHIGPRSSFVLWDQLVSLLLDKVGSGRAADLHLLFAGGIHDACSAAMVAALAAPLSERGARIGVLMGTAYLFTEEAVSSGAIVPKYQEVALGCGRTTVLETGPGHATRCAPTAFTKSFMAEKAGLMREARPAEEVRQLLESLNLGKLRLAAKGCDRNPAFDDSPSQPKLVAVEPDRQVAEGMYMIGQVAALRDRVTTMADLHRAVSDGAVEWLARTASAVEVVDEPAEQPLDVAIVGMACLLPGATDIESFWDNVMRGVDATGEVPPERWDWRSYYDEDRSARDKVYSRWGGFLPEIPFDPLAYGMPPATLRSIEPLQLLTLEVIRAALADAGLLDREFPRQTASVILGAGGGVADLGNRYAVRATLPTILDDLPESVWERLPEWTEDSFAGLLLNVAAGRAANRFDFGGLNLTVDAACASSLAAIYLAAQELAHGRSDVVVAGGIDTAQNPFGYLCFSKTQALSPRGKSRVFDASADGIVISEGLAVVVLKRLRDAQRDGDRIYAVIRGAGGSSDGRGRSMTAPRPGGQMRALARAYRQAGYSPATVGLFEAHGTGTAAGDLAEAETLRRVLEEADAEPLSVAVGSVKSMIGHTKCAAGVTGMIKSALALQRKVLPPTLNVERPNPKAGFGDGPLYVNSELRPWLAGAGGHPRRAGVSAFGFGGTNFHVTLEEYTGDAPSSPQPAVLGEWPAELLLFRGSREGVLARLQRLESSLAEGARPRLRDLAYSCWEASRLDDGPCVATLVAGDVDELPARLRALRSAVESGAELADPGGAWHQPDPAARGGKVAMLFPGQGSQYVDMHRDLAIHLRPVREEIERAERVLEGSFELPLGRYIFPPPAFSDEEQRRHEDALRDTRIAQPALGAVEIAGYRLLRELGVVPDMVAGHSYGEYAALAAAGVLGADDLARVSEARGRWIVEAATRDLGTMAAATADAEVVADCVRGIEDLWIANFNSPLQTVVSGSTPAVEAAVESLRERGVQARKIPVSCAFHSPLVAPARDRLAEVLQDLAISTPSLPVFSNSTADLYPQDPSAIRDLLSQHLVTPVLFSQQIEAMYEAGARLYVEVGPKTVLSGLVRQVLGDRPHLVLALDRPGRSGLLQLQHLLGALAAHGVVVDLSKLFADRGVRRLDLDRLVEETRAEALPPSTWMVSGGNVRPLHEVAEQRPPVAWPAAGASTAAETPPHRPAVTATPAVPAASPGEAAALTAANAVLPSEAARVVQEFQRSMAQIVESQERIMLAYLGGSQAARRLHDESWPAHEVQRVGVETGLGAPVPEASPEAPPLVMKDPASAEPAGVLTTEAGSPSPPETSFLTVEQVLERLVAIVADRTGYPAELVDAGASLEADLGIDSIKRVEILGELQRSLPAGLEDRLQGLMEELTAAATLAEIAQRVGAATAGPAPQVAAEARAPASASSAPSLEQLLEQLVRIVADRTGYPAELVDAGASLEADLGIDSIKRVEILGELQRSLPAGLEDRLQGLMEELTAAPTLAEIAERVAAALIPDEVASAGGGQESSATASDFPAPVPAPRPSGPAVKVLPRFRMQVLQVEAPAAPERMSGTFIIVDDGEGLSAALAQLLSRAGARAEIVDPSDLDPAADASATAGLLAAASDLAGVIFLPPLAAAERSLQEMSFDEWKRRLRDETGRLFRLLQIAAPPLSEESDRDRRPRVLAATALGGDFGLGEHDHGEVVPPSHGGICGLTKTLAVERPDLAVKVVDLDLREPLEALAEHLLLELAVDDGLTEVGWRHRTRRSPFPVAEPVAEAAEAPVGEESVVLLTGGARGITAEVAIALAQRYGPSLVLVGRTPMPEEEGAETAGVDDPAQLRAAVLAERRRRGQPAALHEIEADFRRLMAGREMRATFSKLTAAGVRWEYVAADVRDPDGVRRLAEGLRERHGRLDAVIHGAGTIEDKLIADKSWQSFERVLETKALSAFLLIRELASFFDSLRLVAFFSSVAGAFANRGQADYVAGNEVMNKLALCVAEQWRASGCRVVALNWGPWQKGMASEAVQSQFRARGIEPIAVDDGCRALLAELGDRGHDTVVVLGRGPWDGSTAVPSGAVAQGAGDHDAALGSVAAAAGQRPLLGGSGARRSPNGFSIERVLDPEIDVYLDDHRLDGRPVLPMAAALEMMVELAELGWPALFVCEIRDLSVLKGIALSETRDRLKTVRLDARVVGESEQDGLTVSIEVRDAEDPDLLHYRSTLELGRSIVRPAPHEPAAVERDYPLSIADAYGRYLFHGHRFAHIERIEGSTSSGLLAQIRPSDPGAFLNGGAGSWLIDPVVFDSGLQLVLLWARNELDVTPLPARFARYRRFGPLHPSNGGPIFCELVARADVGASMVRADLVFFEHDGNVLGVLEDLECPASRDLNRLGGTAFPPGAVGTGP